SGNITYSSFMPPATIACETDPNDKCCTTCLTSPLPSGCQANNGSTCNTPLNQNTDNISLRCYDTKRRFGLDLLYPTDRYVTGLTAPQVPNASGQMVDNPIFAKNDK